MANAVTSHLSGRHVRSAEACFWNIATVPACSASRTWLQVAGLVLVAYESLRRYSHRELQMKKRQRAWKLREIEGPANPEWEDLFGAPRAVLTGLDRLRLRRGTRMTPWLLPRPDSSVPASSPSWRPKKNCSISWTISLIARRASASSSACFGSHVERRDLGDAVDQRFVVEPAHRLQSTA